MWYRTKMSRFSFFSWSPDNWIWFFYCIGQRFNRSRIRFRKLHIRLSSFTIPWLCKVYPIILYSADCCWWNNHNPNRLIFCVHFDLNLNKLTCRPSDSSADFSLPEVQPIDRSSISHSSVFYIIYWRSKINVSMTVAAIYWAEIPSRQSRFAASSRRKLWSRCTHQT